MKHLSVFRKGVAFLSSVTLVTSSLFVPGLSTAVIADSPDEQADGSEISQTETVSDVTVLEQEAVTDSSEVISEEPEIVFVEISKDIPASETYDTVDNIAPVTSVHWVDGCAALLAWNASEDANSYIIKLNVYTADGSILIGSGSIQTEKTSINIELKKKYSTDFNNTLIRATVQAAVFQEGATVAASTVVPADDHLYLVDNYLPAPTNVFLSTVDESVFVHLMFNQEYKDFLSTEVDVRFVFNGEESYDYTLTFGKYSDKVITWDGNYCWFEVTDFYNNAYKNYAASHDCTDGVDATCQVRFIPASYSEYTLGEYSESSETLDFNSNFEQLPAPTNVKLNYNDNDQLVLSFDYDIEDPLESVSTVSLIFNIGNSDTEYDNKWAVSLYNDCCMPAPIWNNGTCTLLVDTMLSNSIDSYLSYNNVESDSLDVSCTVFLRAKSYNVVNSMPATSNTVSYSIPYTMIPAPTDLNLSYDNDENIILTFKHELDNYSDTLYGVYVHVYFDGKAVNSRCYYTDNTCNVGWEEPVWTNGSCSIKITDIVSNAYNWEYIFGNVNVSCRVCFIPLDNSNVRSSLSKASNTIQFSKSLDVSLSDKDSVSEIPYVYWNKYDESQSEINWGYSDGATCYLIRLDVYYIDHDVLIASTEVRTTARRYEVNAAVKELLRNYDFIGVRVSATVYAQKIRNDVVIAQSKGISTDKNVIIVGEILNQPTNVSMTDDYILTFSYDLIDPERMVFGVMADVRFYDSEDPEEYCQWTSIAIHYSDATWDNGICTIDMKQYIDDAYENTYYINHSKDYYIECKVSLYKYIGDYYYYYSSPYSDYTNKVFYSNNFIDLPKPADVTITDDYKIQFYCDLDNADEIIEYISYSINFQGPNATDYYDYEHHSNWYCPYYLTSSKLTYDSGVFTLDIKDLIAEQFNSITEDYLKNAVNVWCTVEVHSSDPDYSKHSLTSDNSNIVGFINDKNVLPAPANVRLSKDGELSFTYDAVNNDIDNTGVYYEILIDNYRWVSCTMPLSSYIFENGIYKFDIGFDIETAYNSWLTSWLCSSPEAHIYCRLCSFTYGENYNSYGYISDYSNSICYNGETKQLDLCILSQPNDCFGYVGDTAVFSVDAVGEGLTYQWQVCKSGVWKDTSLAGNKTAKLPVAITTSRDGMKFRCVITDSYTNSVISDEVTLNIFRGPIIVDQPVNASGIIGDTAAFAVEAEGEGLKYQWQVFKSGAWKATSLPGNKTAILEVGVIESRDGMKFRCLITDSEGNSVTSDEVTLTVIPFYISEEPENCTAGIGETVTFFVGAEGEGLTYQWQVFKNGAWKATSLPGNKTNTLEVEALTSRNGMKFRCVVKDINGNKLISGEAALTVTTISITEEPESCTANLGETAVFFVSAEGEGLTYQWQVFKSGAWKNTSLPGNTTSALEVEAIASRDGMKFRCVIKDTYGNKKISEEAVLTILPISIISDPVDYQAAVGETAIFFVKAEGEGLTYQWQVFKSGAWKNTSLPGNQTDTLEVEALPSRDGMKFRCVIKDANGNKLISDEAELSVTFLSIVDQPESYSGSIGDTAEFYVGAQGDELTYQWQVYKNGVWKNTSLAGNKTDTLEVEVLASRDGMQFRCVVTDANGNSETTDTVTINVI